jgi:putative ABC transport system permease protein
VSLSASIGQITSDIRHALRVLRNAPAFTAVAVLSLALGIGANTAIFSLVNAVMLKALPVTGPERLVQVGITNNSEIPRTSLTNPLWEALRDRHGDLFDGAFVFAPDRFDESAGGERRPLDGIWVSGGVFDVLGVRPWIGRMLTPADDTRGGAGPDGPVVVISYAFWRDRYGAAADALGKTLTLNGRPFTIVGVTPPGFYGVEVGRAFKIAVPLGCEPLFRGKDSLLDETGAWWLEMIGRLKPGRTTQETLTALRAAQAAEIAAASGPAAGGAAAGATAGAAAGGPTAGAGKQAQAGAVFMKEAFTLMPASTGTSYLRLRYHVALVTLLGVVGLVLLIACANLANLLLARATARQREFAVRLALGASRPRLIRQLLFESVIIASAGALCGLFVAQWASRLLVRQLTPVTQSATPIVVDLTIDWRVLAFTIAVTLMTALLFGLAPAFRSTDLSAGALMKSGTRSIAGGWRRFNLEKLLITAQIAMSLVLVFGASLFVRSFTSLAMLDPGFKSEHVLVVDVNIRRMDVPMERRQALFEQIGEAMRPVPGVQSMAIASIAIINNGGWRTGNIEVEGFTPSGTENKYVYMNGVSPGYFATMGTAIYAGRDIGPQDTAQSPRVALINQAFARKFFGEKNPVGQRYVERQGAQTRTTEIIGLVQDAKYLNLREAMPPTAYVPIAQDRQGNGRNYVLRAVGDPNALIPSLTSAITGVNKNISFTFTKMDDTIEASLTQERLLAMLAGFCGTLALLVAGIGLYGVMWLAMTRRRSEIGIRMALGAQPANVIRMVLREVAIVTAAGIISGMALAMISGQLVTRLLYGLTSTDTNTWLIAITLLAAIAGLAGYLPARRAARVDPMLALRDE